MEQPKYWRTFDLKVDQNWDRSGKVSLPELVSYNKLMKELLKETGSDKPNPVKIAWIDKKHELFKAINSYIEASVKSLPYKSKSFEMARMQAAKNEGILMKKLFEKTPIVCGCSFGGVEKIMLVANSDLWDQYAYMRMVMKGRHDNLEKIKWAVTDNRTALEGMINFPLQDASVSESWLFHGTSEETMKLISASGFNPAFCRFRGKMAGYGALGKGTYFSDCFSKIATYTSCNKCRSFICNCDSLRSVFLCRIILGNIQVTKQKDMKKRGEYPSNIDSVYGPTKKLEKGSEFGMNEFAVNARGRTYPEFVVFYKMRSRDSSKCKCFNT